MVTCLCDVVLEFVGQRVGWMRGAERLNQTLWSDELVLTPHAQWRVVYGVGRNSL